MYFKGSNKDPLLDVAGRKQKLLTLRPPKKFYHQKRFCFLVPNLENMFFGGGPFFVLQEGTIEK